METIFSGIQPSGELHIGNYLGAIRNWVALIEAGNRCFYCIVDYHAITQSFEPTEMQRRVIEMAADLVACGVDPGRATLFVQSAVREHTELCWVLAASTPFGELERMTQFKDKAQKQPENINAGLFLYPVLQAADIILYKATTVPIGADQLQHLELARVIARRFNARFGEVFPEPQPQLPSVPKILGLDGQAKMSKSLGNTIALRDPPEVIRSKLATAMTDPARQRRKDPGNPDVCNLHTLHTLFSTAEVLPQVREGCRSAGIGCLECKRWLANAMIDTLTPIRERALDLSAHPERVRELLAAGARQAREVAAATIAEVRGKLGLG